MLALACFGVQAAVPTVSGWTKGSGVSTPLYPSADAACQASAGDSNPVYYAASYSRNAYSSGGSGAGTVGATHACYWNKTINGSGEYQYGSAYNRGTAVCPSNSSMSGGVCVCNAGYVEGTGSSAGKCVEPPDPCGALAGQSAGDWWKDVGVDSSGSKPKNGGAFSVCDGYNPQGGAKCVVSISNPQCVNSADDGVSGFWRCTGKGVYTGSKAIAGKCDLATAGSGDSPTDPAPSTPPVPNSDPPKAPAKPDPNTAAPAPCPAGFAPGTLNGNTSCYPRGAEDPSSGGSSSSVKNPDGSTTTTTNQTQCNAGGDKCDTLTTITNCPSGQSGTGCSSTSTSSSGSLTGTCAKDPGNTVCRGAGDGSGSSFGGDCSSGFKAVSDDAVVNAMALEQYKRNCTFFGNDTDPNSTANQAKSGADGKNTDAMKLAAAGSPVSVGAFDTAGYGWGTGCPANPTIPIPWGAGGSVVIPFSRLCGPLSLLSMAGVALTLLGCMVWVVGPKQGGA